MIREHTKRIRPPRALWVPFDLGNPLGAPGRPDFQMAVLRSVLGLLSRDRGPVLEDYPHEAPTSSARATGWSCPIPLPAPDIGESDAERLAARLGDEIARLRPWYEEGRRARGRTTVGLSGLTADGLAQAGRFLAGLATGDDPEPPADVSIAMPRLLRFVADDMKAYYFEAATAQPGQVDATPAELRDWLFFTTVLGDTLLRIRDRFAAAEDAQTRRLQGGFVPAAVLELRSAARR